MTQTNLFEMLHPRFLFPKGYTIKLFEAFSGIGCQKMGLERATKNFKVVGISEIDKYAIKSYEAMHGPVKNFGDITKIKGTDLPEIDIFTYSFPCTDLSKAGKQKGLNKTRSGLVYDVLRIVAEAKKNNNAPKVLIMENVIDLIQVKFIKSFQDIQFELEEMGYSNYTFVINAKDYGVAQNRQRVFMVSILGDYYYEEPKSFQLEKRLKDYLETEVDERYYLTEKQLEFLKTTNYDSSSIDRVPASNDVSNTITAMGGGGREPKVKIGYPLTSREFKASGWLDECPALCARDYKGPKVIIEPVCLNSKVDGKQPSVQDRIYDSNAISTAITTSYMPSITEPVIAASRGRNPQNPSSRKAGNPAKQRIEINQSGLSNTLTTVQKDNLVVEVIDLKSSDKFRRKPSEEMCPAILTDTRLSVMENKLRIRKLTPLECWRLMGIDDDYFYRATEVNSNSQLYKQAGNGIVVDVMEHIFRNMIEV
jgi:DNA-methyltransferase (dcm)